MVKKKIDPIQIRLDAIIRLLSEFLLIQGKVPKNSVYQSLNQTGLSPSDIGTIFGKLRGEIGGELTKIKKIKSKRGKKNESG